MCEPRLPYWHRKASVGLTFAIVPAGTWYPRLRILLFLCVGLRIAPLEIGSITPHTMHDGGQFSCHSDFGFLEADAFHQLDTPSLDSAPFRDACQQDASCLEQITPQHRVAAFGDPASPVNFARGIPSWREANISSNAS